VEVEEDDWAPPEQIDEFRVVGELGRGNMGRVYAAHDRFLDRLVAIKFIGQGVPSDGARARFFVEARAAARLSHPNVVTVYRVTEVGGRPLLVYEYLRGSTLADLEKPLPAEEVLRISTDLACGLAAAHRRGVLHRDIKPANAMRTEEGTTKLLDFGLAEIEPGAALESQWAIAAAPPADRVALARVPSSWLDAGGTRSTLGTRESRFSSSTAGDRALLSSQPAIVGTPLYMAPEIWRGEPTTKRADVYSLGVVMYELCAGHAPHEGETLAVLGFAVLNEEIRPLRVAAPGIDPELSAIVECCLQRDPAKRYRDGEALWGALVALHERSHGRPVSPDVDPYRGLLVFEAEHRELFFGRPAEARILVERLQGERLVVVVGDSGTGKSSLCRAGVLPLIADGALGKQIACIRVPLGRRPFRALAGAIAGLLETDEKTTAEYLRHEPAVLARDSRLRNRRAVLFIDQLEELCTLAPEGEGELVAETLPLLAQPSSGLWVLATARSDFLTRLAALPGLGECLREGLYLLRPLTSERLAEVVVGPAKAMGVSFESEDVVTELVAEAQRADCSLPLLQFALTELWECRDKQRKVIPASALARIGGVGGALARHADSVLASMPQADRDAAREILLLLVTPEGTRTHRSREELLEVAAGSSSRVAHALDALVRGRLLVPQEARDGIGSTYVLVHEALLHAWDTLRGWMSRDAEVRALRHRIERAAAEWNRLGRVADALWKERLLVEASGVEESTLPRRDAEFLAASRRAASLRRFRRWALPVAVGAALLGTLLAALSVEKSRALNKRVGESEGLLEGARSRRDELKRQQDEAFEKFDSEDADERTEAEQVWSAVPSMAAEVEDAYQDLVDRLEDILDIDGGHARARALLEMALVDWACLPVAGLPSDRDPSVRKLAEWGWLGHADARLSVRASPPGARIKLERYDTTGSRWVESSPEDLGQLPVTERMLRPGSWLLSFSRAGSSPVRLPILLQRCEDVEVVVHQPERDEIPEGFVYIPAGRFLYGSAGEDVRSTNDSQPMHSVTTGAYLIKRDETSFAEWIDYLRDLSPKERAARMPSGGRAGHEYSVHLSRLRDGSFALRLGADPKAPAARAGQPIRYRERKHRAIQNWLRMPVTGVSFDDVLAYAAWLDRSGRVPRARLCTDHEWERAARGADGRVFPSGARLAWDAANIDAAHGRVTAALGPDEVGSHLSSASPFGVRDLAGNVWEWVVPRDGMIAARGGCFFQPAAVARSDNRQVEMDPRRDAFYGVRICASYPRH
jgi:eukaryotic-like serine/threonine-protein kinase